MQLARLNNLLSHSINKPFIIFGPSGSGKSTIIKHVISKYPSKFELLVSHTTRTMRDGEIDGKSYYFINKTEFESMIEGNEFIEHVSYSNNLYGTSFSDIERIINNNRVPILDIDIGGVKSMISHLGEKSSNKLFIDVPDIKELEKRLRERGTETEESIKKRLDTAVREIAIINEEGLFDRRVLNIDHEECIRNVEEHVKELYYKDK